MNEEMIKAIKEAKSVEELIAAAKESDIELTEEQAKEYFDRFHASGEISDEELEAVAGGCRAYGHLTVTHGYSCGKWQLMWSDSTATVNIKYFDLHPEERHCENCQYMIYNKGLFQCSIQ